MAHFIARIKGNRGEASRLGTEKSSLNAEVNGWNLGCRLLIEHKNGEDILHISITKGSNNLSGYKNFSFKESEIQKL